jgi:hypothetical protein
MEEGGAVWRFAMGNGRPLHVRQTKAADGRRRLESLEKKVSG